MKKQIISASYGGAFDIEDDQFFTREEINELAYNIEDRLNELYPDHKFRFVSVYIEPVNQLELTMYDEASEEEYTVTEKIDMRKIHKPSDLMKYEKPLAIKLIDAFGISQDTVESATNTCGIPAKVEMSYDYNDKYFDIDSFESTIEVPLNGVKVDFHNDSMEFITYPDVSEKDLELDTDYGKFQIDLNEFLDDTLDYIAEQFPDDDGDGIYEIFGTVKFVYTISDMYGESFYDEYDDYTYDEYYTDISDIRLDYDKSTIVDFDVKKL